MSGILGIILLDLERLWVNRLRVVLSLVQPLLYLFVLGSGLGVSTSITGDAYQVFIYPGIVILLLLFNSSSAAVSIVVDKQVGFLKALLVAPISRQGIAFGKILSGAIQAMLMATLLLLLAPVIGVTFTVVSFAKFFLAMMVSAIVFAALGVGFAARLKMMTSFPVFMNALLLPMFFLSGAIFSLDEVPAWLRMLAYIDPVTYSVDLLRGSLSGHFLFPVPLSLTVLGGFLLAFAYSAVQVFDGRSDGD